MARTVTTYPFGVAISIAGANLRFFLLCLLPYQNPVAFLGGMACRSYPYEQLLLAVSNTGILPPIVGTKIL